VTPLEDYRTSKKSLAERQSEMRARNSVRKYCDICIPLSPETITDYKQQRIVINKARQIFTAAIRRGKIKPQPCKVCGEKAQGHHLDYSKPMDVQWLCSKHHGEQHVGIRRYKPGGLNIA
jgi:hypothetical protein